MDSPTLLKKYKAFKFRYYNPARSVFYFLTKRLSEVNGILILSYFTYFDQFNFSTK